MNFNNKGVEIRDLKILLGDRLILNDVSFEVKVGRLCAILGPNGAGKTSLLRCINGLIKPAKGSIIFKGRQSSNLSRKELSRIVCYVPQNHQPVYDYNVLDFVLMGRTPYLSTFSIPSTKDRLLALKALKILGIEHLAFRNYLMLSGGERQLVLLARSLAQDTSVMLLDEPTSFLDYHNQHLFLETVSRLLRDRGITALISLHDPNLALEYADQIIVVDQKKVLANLNRNEHDFALKLEICLQKIYGKEIRVRNLENKTFVFRGSDVQERSFKVI